jgi:hypothetical protein
MLWKKVEAASVYELINACRPFGRRFQLVHSTDPDSGRSPQTARHRTNAPNTNCHDVALISEPRDRGLLFP